MTLRNGGPRLFLGVILVRRAVVHRGQRKPCLHLVCREATLLLLQLVDGELRQVARHSLLVFREADIQRVDALFERCDPSGKLTVVGRDTLACPIDTDPTALRLVQCDVEILDGTMLLPHACFEGVVQAEVEHSLHEPHPRAQLGIFRGVGRSSQRGLQALYPRPLTALLIGTQCRNISAFLNSVDPRFELRPALLQLVDRTRSEQRVYPRKALSVRMLARVDHVAEGFHAVAPATEHLLHEPQITEVLQAFLEVMARQQRVQIT